MWRQHATIGRRLSTGPPTLPIINAFYTLKAPAGLASRDVRRVLEKESGVQ